MTTFETAETIVTRRDVEAEFRECVESNPGVWVKVPDHARIDTSAPGRRFRAVSWSGAMLDGEAEEDLDGNWWVRYRPEWKIGRWLAAEEKFRAEYDSNVKTTIQTIEASRKSWFRR